MPRKNPAAVELGRLGGQAKSERKTEAARQNAKKGGWPKGRPRKAKKMIRAVEAIGAAEKQTKKKAG